MKTTHGGDLVSLSRQAECTPEEILDFSANLNPFGPPSIVAETIACYLSDVTAYPDPTSSELTSALAKQYGSTCKKIVPGRGATEIIYAIPRCFLAKRALLVSPCYSDYAKACQKAAVPIAWFDLHKADNFQIDFQKLRKQIRPLDIVFIGRPNNPTGSMPPAAQIHKMCRKFADVTFVVDESFIDFSDTPSVAQGFQSDNCIVIRSLTKFYAIAGIRLGASISSENTAKQIRGEILPWSIDTLSQRVGERLFDDLNYASESRKSVASLQKSLEKDINAIFGLHCFPSEANFLLIEASTSIDVPKLTTRLLQRHRIAIRKCTDYRGLDRRFFRVAVRSEKENRSLLAALCTELSGGIP